MSFEKGWSLNKSCSITFLSNNDETIFYIAINKSIFMKHQILKMHFFKEVFTILTATVPLYYCTSLPPKKVSLLQKVKGIGISKSCHIPLLLSKKKKKS